MGSEAQHLKENTDSQHAADAVGDVERGSAAGAAGAAPAAAAAAPAARAAAPAHTPPKQPTGWAKVARPDTISTITYVHVWALLRSRWRYLHALTFYVGPPLHLLSRIAPMLVVNMLLCIFIAADHLMRGFAGRGILPFHEIESSEVAAGLRCGSQGALGIPPLGTCPLRLSDHAPAPALISPPTRQPHPHPHTQLADALCADFSQPAAGRAAVSRI